MFNKSKSIINTSFEYVSLLSAAITNRSVGTENVSTFINASSNNPLPGKNHDRTNLGYLAQVHPLF